MARNQRPGAPWVPGVIVVQLGSLIYIEFKMMVSSCG
jgi:hypothetical protein